MHGEAFAFFHWAQSTHPGLPAGGNDHPGWRCEQFRHQWESLRLYDPSGGRQSRTGSAPTLNFRRDVAAHMIAVALNDDSRGHARVGRTAWLRSDGVTLH